MALIYHVTTIKEWEEAQKQGSYSAVSLATEGFIHCSQEHQVHGVIERYFKGKHDLVKLVIDTDQLKPELKYELAPSVNEEFPHVFGRINLDAVVKVEQLNR
jgi:uncharacterized protein (DUF952 family)